MTETLRILWMNWRCIRHPLAGGAEVYTHEIAKRLAAMGHEVILVTSRPKGLPPIEEIDGYKVLRRGGKYTVYPRAKQVYEELKRKGWHPDTVIDEVNTIPFLTPLYTKEPTIMLIHQLCRDCWTYAIHPLFQPIGWTIEKTLHKIYVKAAKQDKIKAVITVSQSTKQDLLELGYPQHMIHIVPNGLDWNHYHNCPQLAKHKQDLAVYIGRITRYKRLEDLLKAWKHVEQEHPEARLTIAGRPDPKYLQKLKQLANKQDLKHIEFQTNITQEEKKQLLAKAKTLVYTSTREGWGQTILEAAACQTPTIAYNVPGLRDAVKHMETGVLVEPGNIKQLAETITQLLTDNELRSKLAENAYKNAQQYSWDKTAETFLNFL